MKKAWIALVLLTAIHLFGQDNCLLVKRRLGIDAQFEASLHDATGSTVTHFKFIPWSVVEVTGNFEQVKLTYEQSGIYEIVTAPKTYSIERIPNDPSLPWGMTKIQAPLAWDIFTYNPSVVVAVIDTGVDYNHPDLRANMWTGPSGEHGYTSTNGIVLLGGLDDHYHGTHVAGTIGAVGNNGIGVPGVNWGVQIMSLKFIRSTGSGLSTDAALLIERMIDLKQNGVNVRVCNNSYGSGGIDPFLQDAFTAMEQAGILAACSAGNSGADVDLFPQSPAAFANDNIISVMASDIGDNKANFSNYGSEGSDIFAPGVDVLSTFGPQIGGGYGFLSGTSMASPHVAGVAAAMFALNPSLTPAQCKSVLLDPGSYDLTAFPYNSTGGGRLNFFKAITNPKLYNPPAITNLAPVLVLSHTNKPLIIALGETVTITATATDPDGDPLFFTSQLSSEQDYSAPNGIQYRLLGSNYRTNGTDRLNVTGAPLAIDVAPIATFSVSDRHGGGTSKKLPLFVYRDPTKIRDISKAIQSFTTSYTPSTYVLKMRLNVDANLIDIATARFAYWFFENDRAPGGSCCYEPNTDIEIKVSFDTASVYTGRALLMDALGNVDQSEQSVLYLGRTAAPPNIKATWNTTRGPADLSLVADMTATDPNRTRNLTYMRGIWNAYAFSDEAKSPIQTFHIELPGTWAVTLQAFDYANHTGDQIVQLINVLPAGSTVTNPPPPPPDPQPILTPPNNLTASYANGVVRLTWSDTATSETRWEVQRAVKNKGPWGSFQTVATLSANSTAYIIASQGQWQQYRVRACAEACGGYSNTASLRVR
jgi:subtilisin family serine protease